MELQSSFWHHCKPIEEGYSELMETQLTLSYLLEHQPGQAINGQPSF